MNLLVTSWCNLHCKMCDYRMGAFNRNELNYEQIRKLLSDAVEMGLERLDISGGEPMVRKELYDIISFASSLKLRTLLVTNGVLIGEAEAEKLVASGVSAVIISLEGFEQTNDMIRGDGNFRKALGAIRALQKYKEKLDYINVGVTISKANYKQLYDFTKFILEEIGVNSVSYNPFDKNMLYHENYEAVKDIFTITPDMIDDLKEQLQKIIDYKNDFKKPLPPENYLRKIPQYFEGIRMLPDYPCYQPLMGCAVDCSGQVFPCWGEGIAVGNVSEKSFKEIVNSREYIEICNKALSRKCKGCLKSCYVGTHN